MLPCGHLCTTTGGPFHSEYDERADILQRQKWSHYETIRSTGNHRAALRTLISRYGLSRPCVFGSVVTGKDDEDSDLDLLVDPAAATSLMTMAGLQIDAEKLLGVSVSVITPDGLPPKFRDKVLQEAEPL